MPRSLGPGASHQADRPDIAAISLAYRDPESVVMLPENRMMVPECYAVKWTKHNDSIINDFYRFYKVYLLLRQKRRKTTMNLLCLLLRIMILILLCNNRLVFYTSFILKILCN